MLTSAVRSSLKARLERYIVSDDVQISDISDTGMLFHVFGKAIPHACRGWSDISASRLGLPGIDTWAPLTQVDIFPPKTHASRDSRSYNRTFRAVPHCTRKPVWGSEISEKTLPAEAGLDRIAIDFAKGCYVGQEVVSRIRNIGRVNQLLVGFISEGFGAVLPPDSKILDPNSDQCVGALTSAAFHFELGKVVALGYLQSRVALSDKIDFFSCLSFEMYAEGACKEATASLPYRPPSRNNSGSLTYIYFLRCSPILFYRRCLSTGRFPKRDETFFCFLLYHGRVQCEVTSCGGSCCLERYIIDSRRFLFLGRYRSG